ncbi:MAG: diguanylate cyclase, partial [Gammaproteobacteria bacterium]|nr:diguanylate cyclase [Gammaproteobacteria bacterium]
RIRLAVSLFSFATDKTQTVSIGVDTAQLDDSAESLLERVDKGLYCAKNSGRNRVCHL